MKKSILMATLLVLPQIANAQLIDVSGFVQEAQVSEEYLNKLEWFDNGLIIDIVTATNRQGID